MNRYVALPLTSAYVVRIRDDGALSVAFPFLLSQCKNMYDDNWGVVNREVSFICIHSCFFSFCYVDTMCGFTTEYQHLINYKYTVRCYTTYEYLFVYTCHVLLLLLGSVLLYCCCCSCWCLLLLFVIVCWMAKFMLWFLHLIPVFFSFIQTRFIFNVPLGSTVAFTASMLYL